MSFELERLEQLRKRIEIVCKRSARSSKDITILAAAKYADVTSVNRLIAAGISVIGENRVQDAQKKFPLYLPVQKHFIGTLQSNKVKAAVRLFDSIETIYTIEIAQKLDLECVGSARLHLKKMPILVQVNVANDAKKHGLAANDVFDFLQKLESLKNLRIDGLMTIVPYFDDLRQSRPFFRKMKTLFDFCREKYPHLKTLSMGMSHDFEIALEEGSTEIRIGSFLFQTHEAPTSTAGRAKLNNLL